MTNDTFPIRLHEARLMAGLSMDKLVELTGNVVSKQTISKYERGVMLPKRAARQALAKALKISEEYFTGENVELDVPMLRTTKDGRGLFDDQAEKALEARLAYWVEQYIGKETAAGLVAHFENPIADIPVSTKDDAIRAAGLLRERWHCGDGSIPSILRLLERKGIKIFDTPLPADVWGMSTWADKTHPLIVIDNAEGKTTVERLRFTVGHELGHLLMNISTPTSDVEKLCNTFSGTFLLPPATLTEELGAHREELALDELIDLHELYGVSVGALVHTAYNYGIISREHYDWWYDEVINKNRMETSWGEYRFPETLGREKRVEARVGNNDK